MVFHYSSPRGWNSTEFFQDFPQSGKINSVLRIVLLLADHILWSGVTTNSSGSIIAQPIAICIDHIISISDERDWPWYLPTPRTIILTARQRPPACTVCTRYHMISASDAALVRERVQAMPQQKILSEDPAPSLVFKFDGGECVCLRCFLGKLNLCYSFVVRVPVGSTSMSYKKAIRTPKHSEHTLLNSMYLYTYLCA